MNLIYPTKRPKHRRRQDRTRRENEHNEKRTRITKNNRNNFSVFETLKPVLITEKHDRSENGQQDGYRERF